ncbi:MAG: hypothetical protein J6L64_05395 [Opitutales bacterium]|nr:hypothetical protein [Opitutales bacterium]
MRFLTKSVYLFSLAFVLLFSACTTGKFVVSDSANLSKYQYASIVDVMNYSGSAALMDVEVKVYDALSKTRLKMVGDRVIGELTSAQKEKLLLVRFAATQGREKSVVSVNFVDYMTGRPIASCQGAWAFGWDDDHDMEGAIERVAEEVKKLFGVSL